MQHDQGSFADAFNPAANNFDLLRLLLAVLVVFAHCFTLTGTDAEPISTTLRYGFSGTLAVNGFLVISGFLVMRSIQGRDLGVYVLNRAARILPGLALVTLAEVFLIGAYFSSASLWTFLTYVGFRHLANIGVFGLESTLYSVFANTSPPWLMNGSLWTIPIETSFYLVLPALMLLRPRLTVPLLFLASLMAGPWLQAHGINAAAPGPSILTNVHLFHFVDLASYFLSGATAFLYRDRIPFSLGALALCLVTLYAAAGVEGAPFALKLVYPYVILYAAFAGRWGSRLKAAIGDLSYGIYLFGFPVTLSVIALGHGALGPYQTFLATMAVLLPVSWLSWHLVELPSLRLAHRWRRRWTARVPA
jgi:peptidoglycan/LPS O-acetylase OafA/YrhL